MREIKFRAWDKLQKRMLYRGIFDMNWYGTEKNDDKGCHTVGGIQQSDRNILELMQYTGLKDKNGKEIYEGDILKDDRVDEFNLYEIKWNEFGIYADGLEDERYEDIAKDYLEIIGNLYENPNLTQKESE